MTRIPKILPLIVLLIFLVEIVHSKSVYNKLCERCINAQTNEAKVESLSDLSRYFYSLREDIRGDSVLGIAEMIAEESRDDNIQTKILFNCPRYVLLGTAFRSRLMISKDEADKTHHCINKTLEFLNKKKKEDKVAVIYSVLSRYYEINGQMSEAFKYANIGHSMAHATSNDSVKVICALQLGRIYLSQREVVLAFKTYSIALDIASKAHNIYLQGLTYKYFAQLYLSLGKSAEAKDYLYKCLEINKSGGYYHDLIDIYILLANDNDANVVKLNLEKAEKLADSTGDIYSKLEVQKHVFNHKMLDDKETAFDYLNSHSDLQYAIEKTGPNYLDWIIGEIYLYSNEYDSALCYFSQANHFFETSYNDDIKRRFYKEFAKIYEETGNNMMAIKMYEKGLSHAKRVRNVGSVISFSDKLMELYRAESLYKKALYYSNEYSRYKDTLDIFTKEKDIALLEIDNLNKKKSRDEELSKIIEARKHNLQYMIITIAIVTIFIVLMFLGMFTVSKMAIRILGFLSFICFFEFIILLADTYIHHLTHGEPMYIWLIKIALLSLLLPLHHWLEEKITHYLLSEKLVKLRERWAIGKRLSGILWFKKNGGK